MSELSFRFSWKDYGLTGPPILSRDDYTFKAYGLDEFIEGLITRVAEAALKNESVRWKLREFWGIGKSTLLYNLCYAINDRLFFGDALEDTERPEYKHVLAVYVNTPRRRSELLEHTYDNGSPIPWRPRDNKTSVLADRKRLFQECIRKLAYLLLRKVALMSETSMLPLEPNLTGFLEEMRELKNLRTSEFIRTIDSWHRKQPLVYSMMSQLVESCPDDYFAHTMRRFAIAKSPIDAMHNFSELLWPVNSHPYLEGFRSLFGQYKSGLRHFDVFKRWCEATDTSIFLAIDEVEDWSTVTRNRLDVELLSMVSERSLSIVLVFRTDVGRRIQRTSVLKRYLGLSESFETIDYPALRMEQVIEITKAVLSLARPTEESSLFPLTEGYVKELAKLTRRATKFNVRVYISAIVELLQKSLDWKRDRIELADSMLAIDDARTAVYEAIIREISRKKEVQLLDHRASLKYAAASAIAYRLLAGPVPSDRSSLESMKFEYARNLKTDCPSDMEILAAAEDLEKREKLRKILEALH